MQRLLLFIILLYSGRVWGQQEAIQYQFIQQIKVTDAQQLLTDNLGNVYILAKSTLYKYNGQLQLLGNYSPQTVINLKQVDVSNPLKILVLSPDFATVELLDNKLSSKSVINLREIDIQLPQLVCNSYGDGMWIYDQQNFKLKRLDAQFQVQNESININQFAEGTMQPNYMLERNNALYVNNPTSGVLVFDLYGAYIKTIPVLGINQFQVLENKLLFIEKKEEILSDSLSVYDMKFSSLRRFPLPTIDINTQTPIISSSIQANKLYLLRKEMLVLYSF